MSDDNIAKQGIDAYLEGDEENARLLLTQAVEQDPDNADAWYYLSRIYSEPAKIRECLQRALNANPDHTRAQRALRELDPIMIDSDDEEIDDSWLKGEPSSSSKPPSGFRPPFARRTESESESSGDKPPNEVEFPKSPFTRSAPKGKATPPKQKRGSGGDDDRPSTWTYQYGIPKGIPGAPESMSVEELWEFYKENTQTGIKLLSEQDTPVDTAKASWWHIWLIVFSIGFVTSLVVLITLLLINARAVNVLNMVSVPFLYTVRALIGVGAAGFFTHWYLTNYAGKPGTLLDHTYVITMLWAPASLANLALFVVARLLGGGIITFPMFIGGGIFNAGFMTLIMTFVALGLALWTIYRMRQAFEALYGVGADPRQYWFAAVAVLIIVSVVF